MNTHFDKTRPDKARRNFLQIFAGGSVALAGLALAGCADMGRDPEPPRPRTRITGRGGGPGNPGGK